MLRRVASRINGSADIKLNTRLLVANADGTDSVSHRIFPGQSQSRQSKHFPADGHCLKQVIGLMIRFSSYGGTNYGTNPSAPTKLPRSLEIEYRELLDLRERVRMAEAAAGVNRVPPTATRPDAPNRALSAVLP